MAKKARHEDDATPKKAATFATPEGKGGAWDPATALARYIHLCPGRGRTPSGSSLASGFFLTLRDVQGKGISLSRFEESPRPWVEVRTSELQLFDSS
ncbi:hypothetical protein MRX96_004435 [Rhipicephalus microplus]